MARTSKLTDLQFILLATASQRRDGSLPPWPRSLADHHDEIPKAIRSLIRRKLVEEIEGTNAKRQWREQRGKYIGAMITDAGRAAIAAEQQLSSLGKEVDNAAGAPIADPSPPRDAARVPDALEKPIVSPARGTTKQAQLLDLLQRPGGISLGELASALNWLPHTTRAALTGLRKKGYAVTTEKVDGVTHYHVAADV